MHFSVISRCGWRVGHSVGCIFFVVVVVGVGWIAAAAAAAADSFGGLICMLCRMYAEIKEFCVPFDANPVCSWVRVREHCCFFLFSFFSFSSFFFVGWLSNPRRAHSVSGNTEKFTAFSGYNILVFRWFSVRFTINDQIVCCTYKCNADNVSVAFRSGIE